MIRNYILREKVLEKQFVGSDKSNPHSLPDGVEFRVIRQEEQICSFCGNLPVRQWFVSEDLESGKCCIDVDELHRFLEICKNLCELAMSETSTKDCNELIDFIDHNADWKPSKVLQEECESEFPAFFVKEEYGSLFVQQLAIATRNLSVVLNDDPNAYDWFFEYD